MFPGLNKNFFRLNIFVNVTVYMSFFIRTFSLYQKKVVIAFIKRTVDHFYHRPDDFGD